MNYFWGLAKVIWIGAIALSACTSNKNRLEQQPAAKIVHSYNMALVKAYQTNDPDYLKPYATLKEYYKVLVLIDLKKSNRLVLESKILDYKTTQVNSPATNTAQVETEELWEYYDRPLDPGVETSPTFKVRMQMRYDLVWEDGALKVYKGITLNSDYIEPSGYRITPGSHGVTAEEYTKWVTGEKSLHERYQVTPTSNLKGKPVDLSESDTPLRQGKVSATTPK